MTAADWRDAAACRDLPKTVFFPEPTATAGEKGRHTDYEPAIAICATCPVRTACLEAALVANEEHGVFGGTTPRQRKKLRKEQGITGRKQPTPLYDGVIDPGAKARNAQLTRASRARIAG